MSERASRAHEHSAEQADEGAVPAKKERAVSSKGASRPRANGPVLKYQCVVFLRSVPIVLCDHLVLSLVVGGDVLEQIHASGRLKVDDKLELLLPTRQVVRPRHDLVLVYVRLPMNLLHKTRQT